MSRLLNCDGYVRDVISTISHAHNITSTTAVKATVNIIFDKLFSKIPSLYALWTLIVDHDEALAKLMGHAGVLQMDSNNNHRCVALECISHIAQSIINAIQVRRMSHVELHVG